MPRKDLSRSDAAERAAHELTYVLDRERRKIETPELTVSVEEALTGERALQLSSDRDVTRVLFISRNVELLNPTEQTLDGFIKLSDLFEEVHILILRQGIVARHPVLRVAPNVWIYTATAANWWWTPIAGIRLVHQELVFAEGFRPDLIVARDPFECAYVASVLGRKFDRPTQLHILEDYTSKEFKVADRHNRWRRFLPRFLIPRFLSVRTQTQAMRDLVERTFTIRDLNVLPRYRSYEALIKAESTIDLKSIYKPFVFFILFIGNLSYKSTLFRTIDAARFVLRNPRVGLIVLGDGEARKEFEKRASLLGIAEQVVFERRMVDQTAYLKSANLLIVTDTDDDSNEVALRGAAAGIPLVLARNEERSDLFVDGESAFLCAPEDIQQFTDRIDDLLNNFALRKQLTLNASAMIAERFHEDPMLYRTAYRTSIEEALFVESEPETPLK